MVLATVYDTVGSTYSKAGGQMLIEAEGQFSGMLSGGCLEGDLVERARQVMRTLKAETASYDLAGDDELWGLGVGCDGTMHVLLQPLLPEQDFQPFAAIADAMAGGTVVPLAIVIDADSATFAAGAAVLLRSGNRGVYGMSDVVADCLVRNIDKDAAAAVRQVATPEGVCSVLFTTVTPPPALLVLGAGLDAEPVVRIASELGWRCTLCDHRPAYVESRSLPAGCQALCFPVDKMHEQVQLDDFDMAIVMSHHLASDRLYLRQLAATAIGYIGLLGPAGRRERLMHDLGDIADVLGGRLHGPAGINIGGRGPGPIALAIVAEMQQFLNQRG